MTYTDDRQVGEEKKEGAPQAEVTPEMIRAFRDWYDDATTIEGVTDVSEPSIVRLLSTCLCIQARSISDRASGTADQLKAIPAHLGRVTGLRGQNGKMVATTESGVDVILPDAGTIDLAGKEWTPL